MLSKVKTFLWFSFITSDSHLLTCLPNVEDICTLKRLLSKQNYFVVLTERHSFCPFASVVGIGILVIAVGLMTCCVDKSKVTPSPETARRELALKGITFDEKTFIDEASSGEVVNVKLFLAAGINPNAKSEKGDAALIAAAINNQIKVIDALIAGGADLTITDKQGLTALMRAARDSRLEAVNALISHGADVNSLGNVDATALMFTSVRGDVRIANALIDANANVNVREREVGTALSWAAYYDRLEIARVLIAHGADPNIKNDSGGTPLMMAAYNGNQELVQALLDKGANRADADNERLTAEKWALRGHHDETARMLTK